MFETLAVAEILKWIRTMLPDVELFYFRTRSGMEVDLLVESPRGVLGIEFKQQKRVDETHSLWAIPLHRLV